MIRCSSNAPVLVKKIGLKLWRLRSEIEAYIQEQMDEEGPDSIEVSQLQEIYRLNELDGTQVGEEEATEGDEDGAADAALDLLAGGEEEEEGEEEEGEELEVTEEEAEDTISSDNILYLDQFRPPLQGKAIFNGRVLLYEIDINKMFFFSEQKMMEGESICVEFLIPKKFILNGIVLYCSKYNLKNRIISVCNLPYRAAIEWTFLKEGERTLLRQFLGSIEPDIPEPPKKAAKQEDDDGDDFSDLDDLDF